MVDPELADLPLAGMKLSIQYESAGPAPWRATKRPVMSKLTSALVIRSRSRSTSPAET